MKHKSEQEIAAGQAQGSEELIESIRKEREVLLEQVRQSQDTIRRSQELIARLDQLLMRLGTARE